MKKKKIVHSLFEGNFGIEKFMEVQEEKVVEEIAFNWL